MIGSLDLVQSLLRLGLIDQLALWVHPVVLGSGKKVFGSGAVPVAVRLTDSTIYPDGSVNLVYQLAGAPTYGNLAGDAEECDRARRTAD